MIANGFTKHLNCQILSLSFISFEHTNKFLIAQTRYQFILRSIIS